METLPVTEQRVLPSAAFHWAVTVSSYSAPCYQATSPTQPFAVGPSPKQATVSEWPLVGTLSQGGHQADSEVRVGPRPSPQGPPVHPALGQRVIWGPRGQVGGCVLLFSRALIVGPHWPGPGLEVVVTLFLPLSPHGSSVCLGLRLQDLHAPHMGHLRSLRAGWVGCPAPSALMAEQGLRTRP